MEFPRRNDEGYVCGAVVNINYHFTWCSDEVELWQLKENGLYECIFYTSLNKYTNTPSTIEQLHLVAEMFRYHYKDYKTYDDVMKDHFDKML